MQWLFGYVYWHHQNSSCWPHLICLKHYPDIKLSRHIFIFNLVLMRDISVMFLTTGTTREAAYNDIAKPSTRINIYRAMCVCTYGTVNNIFVCSLLRLGGRKLSHTHSQEYTSLFMPIQIDSRHTCSICFI